MNFRLVILALLFIPHLLMATELQFRRDSDSVTWVLAIKDTKYVISECALDGKIRQTEGVVSKVDGFVVLKNDKAGAQPNLVDGKRFFEKQVDGVVYLIEKERAEEFAGALKEGDRFVRETLLRDFFRQVPSLPRD
jgi:hypothetical protein